MAHEQTVMDIMESLGIGTKHQVAEVMAVKVGWKPGPSAINNTYKALARLTQQGKLEQGKGFFRVPSCRSDYSEHAQLLSQCIAEILKLPFQIKVKREHTIQEVGLRPDALMYIQDENRGLCFVLEVINHEPEVSLTTKANVWNQWKDAPRYLSKLFGAPVTHFDFVRSDELGSYLKEMVYEHTNGHQPHFSLNGGASPLCEAVD